VNHGDEKGARGCYGPPGLSGRGRGVLPGAVLSTKSSKNHLTELSVWKACGLKFAGISIDDNLVEVIEVDDHPWFIACQFHPEFTSTPRNGHPLFKAFVEAASQHKQTTH